MELRRFFIITLIILNIAVFFKFLGFDEQTAEKEALNNKIKSIKEYSLPDYKRLNNIMNTYRPAMITALNHYKNNQVFGKDVLFQGKPRQFLSFMIQHDFIYSGVLYDQIYDLPDRQFTYMYDRMLVIECRYFHIVHRDQVNTIEISNYFLNHESKEVIKLIALEENQWYYVESKQITRD